MNKPTLLRLCAVSIAFTLACESGSKTPDEQVPQTAPPAASNASPAEPGVAAGILLIPLGPGIQEPVYDPDAHQRLLARPPSWCGAARRNDPLIADVVRIVTGELTDSLVQMRLTHNLPMLSPDAVFLVRDEAVCEKAAKAFDRITHAGDFLAEHKRLRPVLVVPVGDVYVVEEARPRGDIWSVEFFDADWRPRGFGYGAGH
jgi:hypothetical protein